MIPGPQSNHPTFRRSFGFAWQGFRFAFVSERNLKVMLTALLVTIVAGFVCQLDAWRWCVVLLCCGLVIFGEPMNTALETIVDLVSPEYNSLAGHAKDIAAAAEFWLSGIVGIVGLIIFITRIIELAA